MDADAAEGARPLPSWLRLLLFALVVYRVAYHVTYLGEVPFALATFSDGAIHEATARDLLDRFPLGTTPFFREGVYAYVLAIGMLPRAWISFGLLFQLLLGGLGLWAFHRASVRAFGRFAGALSTVVLLASAEVLFYENKYIAASTGVMASCLLLLAATRAGERAEGEGAGRVSLPWIGVGASLGLLMLVRFDAIWVLVPLGLLLARSGRPARASALGLALGLGLALAPMAARNLAVTGHPDLTPVQGSGPGFYAGNNPEARGVWNAAGGVVGSFAITDEVEMAEALGVEGDDARSRGRAVSRALWRRGAVWIGQHPGTFMRLSLRKLWLTLGNDQLGMLYDRVGEEELIGWAHRVSLPLGALLALCVLGLGDPAHRELLTGRALAPARAAMLGVVAVVVGSALVFYAAAPDRLPVYVPLAWLSGPGLVSLARFVRRIRRRDAAGEGSPSGPSARGALVAALLATQAAWPRVKDLGHAHPVFYYNLAIAEDEIGQPRASLTYLDRAVALRPGEPAFRLRRAHLRRRLGNYDGCEADIRETLERPERLTPAQRDWILLELELLQIDRDTAAAEAEKLRRDPG